MKAALFALVGSAVVLAFPQGVTAASGRVTVKYSLGLAGLPIGTASLNAVINRDTYRIDAGARIGGILALVSDGRGSGTASGRMNPSKPTSSGYALSSMSSDKLQTVRMSLASGTITKAEVSPPLAFRNDRIPVAPGDKRGVLDPLSALLMPVAGSGELTSPAACERTLNVFDGAQRFDVTLAYSRMEKIIGRDGLFRPRRGVLGPLCADIGSSSEARADPLHGGQPRPRDLAGTHIGHAGPGPLADRRRHAARPPDDRGDPLHDEFRYGRQNLTGDKLRSHIGEQNVAVSV